MSKEIIEDLISFLKDERIDLRTTACTTIAQLTGTPDGLKLILQQDRLIISILNLIHDSNNEVAETALKILTNISSEECGSTVLFTLTEVDVIAMLVSCIKNPDYLHADHACAILANMTRSPTLCPRILALINQTELKLEGLVFILCQIGYNKKGAQLNLLASVISNFTQSKEGRKEILNKEKCIFERLLPFIEYSDSKTRRKAIISVAHNCCFEKDSHEWLLSDDVGLASRLALPLAGPDNFSPEETDSLPSDLQFLPDDKTREEDAQLRELLLEAFMQLCSTRKSRERLRDLNIYLILREHHKWEPVEKLVVLNEDVVNLLIKTEDEIGEDDLSALDVPPDLAQKFSTFDSGMMVGAGND